MGYTLRQVTDADADAVIAVFNVHTTQGHGAFLDAPAPPQFFTRLRRSTGDMPFYVVEDGRGRVVGYGRLYPYDDIPAFAHCACIGYFVLPEHTRRGVGGMLLAHLEADARARGITTLVAATSSLNEPSMGFHQSHLFFECGRFVRAGRKFGQAFDLVWFQKML
jgi:L-amino acid N-acyltransferase YncA